MDYGKRERLFRLVDKLIFRIATRKHGFFGPGQTYQPLPWAGVAEGLRAIGSERRLEAILAYIQTSGNFPQATLDIGANVGYFSLAFAERGAMAYAVESEPLNARIAMIASQYVSDDKNGVYIPIRIWCKPENVHTLPQANVTFCLSIWHHWVKHLGLDGATAILDGLLAKTSDTLFFDTGEDEMPADYRLPFAKGAAKEWLIGYLGKRPNVSNVQSIGEFAAFMPSSDERRANVTRSLFAVETRRSGP